MVFPNQANAHAVQLGYCTSCNGDLRIWIEHWHGSEDPSTTSLDVTITVNGVPTTITGAPDTSVINVPYGSLPGCFNPINFFASCPGDANMYNDWVAYDFPGVACNVPISVVVTANANTTVFTQDCGGMYPASTGTFIIPCATNQLPDIDTCANNTIGPFNFPAGNTWTNDNINIGLPASGAGNIPAFTPTNLTSTQVGNIVVTNSCGISTFTITVNPAPTSNFIANVGCPGQPITFTEQSTSAGGPITSWQWDYGDGSPIYNGQNPPSHIYGPGGPFNVTLTTTTGNGCVDDTIISVDPLGGLVANFTSPSVCNGTVSILTDASTPIGNILSWAWDWNNDGVVDDVNQNSSFTFSGPGTFNVELAVVGVGGCTDSIVLPVVINPIPVANFAGTNECLGFVSTFTDLSTISSGIITNWSWDFGDLLTTTDTSSLQNPTYTYANSGTYTVSLTITSDSGCIDIFSTQIDVFVNPTANFTTNIACNGKNTIFTDASTLGSAAITNWNWDFDADLVVDNINQNPTYIFPSAGSFLVNLNLVDANGCINDTTLNVTVSAQPTAIFSHTIECFGATTAFTDLSNPNGGTISNWDWDFTNNGTVDNASQNPTNGYPAAGSYTVELLVTTTDGCVDSTTMLVVVNPIPFADFSVADVCFGTISTFTDLSTISTGAIIDWQWNFGDLLTTTDTSSLQNPTYNYTIPGTYPVTLTITSDSGCINTVIDSAHVLFLPTAAFTTNNECFNAVASFTDNSNGNGGIITNWLWDFDNNGTTDNTNQNPTNLYPSPNTYTIQLIVSTGFGCADTTTQPITIYPMPVADFTFVNACFGAAIAFTDNSSVTSGTITNWNWNFGNSNTSIVQNPSENYSSEGVYNVQLIASTNNACSDTIVQQIEVWPIPVVDFSPTEVCLNAASQFTDLSTVSSTNTTNNIIQWQWNFGDGVGTSNLQNPIYTYTTEGIYPTILTVTSNHGCFYDTTINVTVNPLPQVIFGDPTAGCAPNMCVNFVNNSTINQTNLPASIDTWQWDFGDDFSSTSMNPSHCYENSSYSVVKNYDVTLTATSNKQCVTTVTIPQLITVYPKPLADFDYTPLETDIYDSKITFIDQSIIASQWFWNLGDGATSTESNPIHNYADSGFYSVTLYMENVYGCRDTTQKTVRIKPTFAIWIPNTFTPDGDGINDYFFVDGYGIKELQTFVFDRWGMLLFDGYFLDSKWSGFYKGKKCQEDVYVYKIRAKDVFNEWHEYIGKITLLK